MDGVELILAALAAGGAAGVSDAAGSAVRDAYTGLRELLRRRLGQAPVPAERDPDAEPDPGADPGAAVGTATPTAADTWQVRLRGELTTSGADRDEDVLAAARTLLALLDTPGKYAVDAREAKGVQIGDHNTQTNTFS